MSADVEQIIGREGETATLLSRGLFNSELRVGGFAPRQLNRCAASLKIRASSVLDVQLLFDNNLSRFQCR